MAVDCGKCYSFLPSFVQAPFPNNVYCFVMTDQITEVYGNYLVGMETEEKKESDKEQSTEKDKSNETSKDDDKPGQSEESETKEGVDEEMKEGKDNESNKENEDKGEGQGEEEGEEGNEEEGEEESENAEGGGDAATADTAEGQEVCNPLTTML